ncbi:hypothetical protein PENARI_c066G04429 [Penicillium arizonense]|uniref:MULE transposase domain-containing protein n=1 Tax=Penicillium arizonense TaxID=1835702 RepID=A0A1F5L2A1_PENAI|nr:hypothetical protein PENARI_c066G04429 [Penicillium arizonense]OGE47089.1 hypothetical protein PENARI_c066G04429 [Penicillium arizonense]
MASSQPDSPSDSEPEAIPESPPTLPSLHDAPPSLQNTAPSLHDAPPSLPDAIPESSPPIPSLYTFPLPPLDQQYDTPERGIAAVNAFAREHGYAVSIFRSIAKKGVKKIVQLCCDRGRTLRARPDNGPERKRQTTSIAINCPFLLRLRLQEDGRWKLTVDKQEHNHEPSPPSTHVAQRKQELSTKVPVIKQQLQQGLSTRHILTSIRKEDEESCLTARDVYNLRRKLHIEFLAGRTPLQALLIELPRDGEWIFKHEVDNENHVTALFCMHKSSIAMLRTNSWVISMDCTYKTNRYGLPLLDIIGFVATGSSFYVGFAFMKDEKQDSYEVILSCLAEAFESLTLEPPQTILTDKEEALMNAVKVVFPSTKHMICLWHINMNIMKKARPILAEQLAKARQETEAASSQRRTKVERDRELREMVNEAWKTMLKLWIRIVYAITAEEREEKWKQFNERYKEPIFEPLLDYLRSEWLDDCPEYFLYEYTSEYLHLNEISTSRTEGAHWLLKQDLQVSTNDLLVVLRTFENAVKLQFRKATDAIENEKIRSSTDSRWKHLFRLVVGRVSAKAMGYTKDVYNRFLPEADNKPLIPLLCRCNSKNTAGFPCIHLIRQYEEEKKSFEPELFHQHWHLYSVSAPPINPLLLLQDPLQVRRRGRPQGARNFIGGGESTQASTQDASTQRDPSGFELILSQEGGRGRGRGRGRGGTQQASQGVGIASSTAQEAQQASQEGGRGRGRARGRGTGRGGTQQASQGDTMVGIASSTAQEAQQASQEGGQGRGETQQASPASMATAQGSGIASWASRDEDSWSDRLRKR